LAAFGGWIFRSCGNSLLLAENYNQTTTNNAAERTEDAQRLLGGVSGLSSSAFAIYCELWACLARQPIDHAASLEGSTARVPGSAAHGPGHLGRISVRRAGILADAVGRAPGKCGGNVCGRICIRKKPEAYRFFFLSDFINWRYSSVVIPAFTSASIVLGSCSREFRIEGVAS